MLGLLDRKLEKQGLRRNWKTLVADHRKLPIENESIDLVISGWSVCYLAHTGNEKWKENLEQVISEMKRVLRPGGTIIIFETMGTGTEIPNPPDFLIPYFNALIEQYGFNHRWIRADYEFASFEEAKAGMDFFFGEELVKKIAQNRWSTVPECAGIWWKHITTENNTVHASADKWGFAVQQNFACLVDLPEDELISAKESGGNMKQQLIADLNQFPTFVRSIENLKDEVWYKPLGEGKWRIHDIITHIMRWDDDFNTVTFPKLVRGEHCESGRSSFHPRIIP